MCSLAFFDHHDSLGSLYTPSSLVHCVGMFICMVTLQNWSSNRCGWKKKKKKSTHKLFFSPAYIALLFQPDLFFYLSQDTAATMTQQKWVAKAMAAWVLLLCMCSTVLDKNICMQMNICMSVCRYVCVCYAYIYMCMSMYTYIHTFNIKN